MVADKEVDKVANKVADILADKVANMVADVVAQMAADKKIDMELDMVADMATDMFKTKCIHSLKCSKMKCVGSKLFDAKCTRLACFLSFARFFWTPTAIFLHILQNQVMMCTTIDNCDHNFGTFDDFVVVFVDTTGTFEAET